MGVGIAAISSVMQRPPDDTPHPHPLPASDSLGLGDTIAVPELHAAPVFYPSGTRLIWISDAGEISDISREAASARLRGQIAVLCHRRWSEARAGCEINSCLDVMELFAFVRPARFCLPTPRGLAAQLGLAAPQSGEDMAALLPRVAFTLLDELADAAPAARREAGGERLLGEGRRVSRKSGHDRGTELDAFRLAPDDRAGRHRIEAEDIRDPDRREAARLQLPGSGDEAIE